MSRFINAFTWNQAPNDEFFSLLPTEQANIRKLIAEGKLLHIFLPEDNSGGWAIFNGESLEDVLAVVEQMPLHKFMNVNVKKLAEF